MIVDLSTSLFRNYICSIPPFPYDLSINSMNSAAMFTQNRTQCHQFIPHVLLCFFNRPQSPCSYLSHTCSSKIPPPSRFLPSGNMTPTVCQVFFLRWSSFFWPIVSGNISSEPWCLGKTTSTGNQKKKKTMSHGQKTRPYFTFHWILLV